MSSPGISNCHWAGLRQHFGVVLNYWANRAHWDHFHVDTSRPVGWFPRSRQCTRFVQLALTHLFGRPVTLDWRWGPQTRAAAQGVLVELDGPVSLKEPGGWLAFCQAVELSGWGRAEAV